MRHFFALLFIFLVTSVATDLLSAAELPLVFTPQTGFSGASEGQGSLKLFFGKTRPFHVESRGSEQSDGTFRLDQTVTVQGEAPRTRFWIMSTTTPNHYSATLSDAAGPVQGVTTGSTLSLHYRIKGPLVMHQKLKLAADGQTIDNVGVIRLLGVPVGHLRETITRK